MRIQWKVIMLLPMVQLAFAAPPAFGQFGRWYMPPNTGNLQTGMMGTGFRGVTPNGLIGANAGALPPSTGAGPFSSGGAPPIGKTQPVGVGDINVGGAFGGGSVAGNGQLNGAVSNGFVGGGSTLTGNAQYKTGTAPFGNGFSNGRGQVTNGFIPVTNGAGQITNGGRSLVPNGSVPGTNGTAQTGTAPTGGAENDAADNYAAYSGLYAASGAYGGGGGGGYGGFTADPVSAYATAYYSGLANLIRAQGAYEMEDAQAMIGYERARTKYVDNQQKVFYARQAAKRLALADQADERETHKADRAKRDDFLAAHRPQPLSHEDLDPWDGTIQWPVALKTADFDDLRASLDESFSQKARGYDKSAVASKIHNDVEEMRNRLHQQITKIPLHDYSEARKFLDSMAVSIH